MPKYPGYAFCCLALVKSYSHPPRAPTYKLQIKAKLIRK